MNYLKRSGIIGAVCVFAAGIAQGAVIVVDDFNSYNSSSYIQVQNPLWSRFGAATSDGITSITAGVGGTRGASYSTAWTAGNTGDVRYTFSATQNLSTMTDVTLDLNVATLVAGTTVSLQLRSGATFFQSTTPLSLTNTTYSTFDFSTLSASLTRVAGTGSYASTMSAIDSIVFVFTNTGGTGSQAIRFDNFDLVTSVPEPGSIALMGLAGAMFTGYYVRRRRRNGAEQ